MKFIAEICQNHNGKPDLLKKMIYDCAKNKADYIKMQYIFSKNLTFRPIFENGFCSKDKSNNFIKRPYKNEFKRLKKLDLHRKYYDLFVKICENNKIDSMITCFTRGDLKMLREHGFKTVKIASYDCSSFQLLRELEGFKKIFVSTGASYLSEIEKAAKILNGKDFTFLYCLTVYPTPIRLLNFKNMLYLKKFSKKIGYSDHSKSTGKFKNLASYISIFFNADFIERHVRVLSTNETKDGIVSILPEDILSLKIFDNLSKKNQEDYLINKFNFKKNKFMKNELFKLSSKEIMNRDYYKGRFATFSKKEKRFIYNWEEVKI